MNFNVRIFMKINSVQNNYSMKPSFGSVRIRAKGTAAHQIKDTKTLEKYLKHAKGLENLKIDLTEMIKSWKLTSAEIYVLKNFLSLLGRDEMHNLTVDVHNNDNGGCVYFNEPDHKLSGMYDFVKYQNVVAYYNPLFKSPFGYYIKTNNDKKQYLAGKAKDYEGFWLPSQKLVLSAVEKILKNDIEEMAAEVDSRFDKKRKEQESEEIRSVYLGKYDKGYQYLNIHPEKRFPMSSFVCTLDDIIKYVNQNKKWNDYNQVYYIDYDPFNEPVTEDGETLLIALTRILPNAENAEKYRQLIEDLTEHLGLHIDFNQKDRMGISFIEHVINSKNLFLLTLAAHANDLKYEPEMEYAFNRIDDEEFKRTVISLDLFNNMSNLQHKIIFGQPNPIPTYKNL